MPKFKYQVFKTELIAPTVRLITLVPQNELRPMLHLPGQYAAISLHDRQRPTATRCFSIASSPNQQQKLQFSIRVNGRYTSALERLEAGDEILVRGPFGRFVFNEHKHKDVVFLAGGIGIAPFMSMIRYADERRLSNKMHLIYSCRNQRDAAFFSELQEIRKRNPTLRITYAISRGDHERLGGSRVISGRLDASNIGALGLNFQKQVFMICGPAAYLGSVRKLLQSRGVPEQNILSESFSQGAGNRREALTRWPLRVYALAGLALAVAAIFVAGTDINKTLHIFKDNDLQKISVAPKTVSTSADINSLKSQPAKTVVPANNPQTRVS